MFWVSAWKYTPNVWLKYYPKRLLIANRREYILIWAHWQHAVYCVGLLAYTRTEFTDITEFRNCFMSSVVVAGTVRVVSLEVRARPCRDTSWPARGARTCSCDDTPVPRPRVPAPLPRARASLFGSSPVVYLSLASIPFFPADQIMSSTATNQIMPSILIEINNLIGRLQFVRAHARTHARTNERAIIDQLAARDRRRRRPTAGMTAYAS